MPFTLQITVMSSPFATVAVNAGEFPSRTAACAGATVMVTALGVGGGSGGGPKKLGGTAEPTAAQPHRYAAITSRRQTDSSGPKSARRIFPMTVEIVLVIFYLRMRGRQTVGPAATDSTIDRVVGVEVSQILGT